MIEGLSRPEESYEEPLFQIPQPGEIQENFHSATLAPEVVSNTIKVATGIFASTQTTDIATSSGARGNFIATSMEGTSVATSAPETTVAPDSASMSACKAPVMTLEIRQLVIKHAPALIGEQVYLRQLLVQQVWLRPLLRAHLSPFYLQDRPVLQSGLLLL